MKRLFLLLLALLVPLLMSAQIAMSAIGEPELVPDDMDARSYSPEKDANDLICAIIKVSLNAPVKGMLVMGTRGGLATVKTEKQANGEWWFWVSPVVTNVMLSCEGYNSTPFIPVALKGGSVYRLKLNVDASVAMVTTYTLQRSAMKLNISPKEATVSYGKNEDYDMGREKVTDGQFDKILIKGTYYYKVESPYYETITGKYVLSDDSEEVSVILPPSFSFLSLDSEPQGAEVFVNGKSLGVTPIQKTDKIAKGRDVEIEFRKDFYYLGSIKVDVAGNGEMQQVPSVKLRPQFGFVTCLCDDPDAELVITNAGGVEHRGKSGMRVRLPSDQNYKIEAVRPSHTPQQLGIDGSSIEGKEVSIKVDAPIPIYGELQAISTPSRADVYIDGEKSGTTSFVKMVLIGEHNVELKLEGYRTESFKVIVKKDEPICISGNLQELPKLVYVKLKTNGIASLLVDGVKYTNPSTVMMEVGRTYRIESQAIANRSNYRNSVVYYQAKYGEDLSFEVPAPKLIGGTLFVSTGSVTGADLIITGNQYVKREKSPLSLDLPVGTYNVFASKQGYSSITKNGVEIKDGQTTSLDMKLRKESSLFNKLSKDQDYFANYFLNLSLGSRQWEDDVVGVFGANLAYCSSLIGVYGQYLYCGYSDERSVSAGPIIRLTSDTKRVDFQVYGGAGWMYNTYGWELGTRFGWHSGSLSWWDIGVGFQKFGGQTATVFQFGLGITLTVAAVLGSVILAVEGAEDY